VLQQYKSALIQVTHALSVAFLIFLSLTTVAQAKPAVVATILPLHSLVANVMRDVDEPILLIEGAGSPHAYSLSPSNARALATADRVFWIGPEMESFLPRVLANLAPAVPVELMRQSGMALLPLREGGAWQAHDHDPDDEDDHQGEDDHERRHATNDDHDHDDVHHHDGAEDAHLWLDPHRAMRMVEIIAAELSVADPDNSAVYLTNATRTVARLKVLDRELARELASVSEVPYVVFHDAYQYFEARYRLHAVGSITVSPDQAPGARRLYEIRAKIAETGARCIFSEPQFEPRLVATVIEGTATKTATLDPIGAALEPGPDAYFTLLRNTASALRACLSD